VNPQEGQKPSSLSVVGGDVAEGEDGVETTAEIVSGIGAMGRPFVTNAVARGSAIGTGGTEMAFGGEDRLRRDEVGRRPSETTETVATRPSTSMPSEQEGNHATDHSPLAHLPLIPHSVDRHSEEVDQASAADQEAVAIGSAAGAGRSTMIEIGMSPGVGRKRADGAGIVTKETAETGTVSPGLDRATTEERKTSETARRHEPRSTASRTNRPLDQMFHHRQLHLQRQLSARYQAGAHHLPISAQPWRSCRPPDREP
jgi:hypothetical protein